MSVQFIFDVDSAFNYLQTWNTIIILWISEEDDIETLF